MSGGLKSGLLFALISLVAVVGVSFVPVIGAFCCGPVATMALAGIAGYLGVRWSGPTAGVGSGVLAGSVAGVGALVGSIIFWIAALLIVQSDPALLEQIIQQVEEQQPSSGLTRDDIRNLINVMGPLLGFCAGLIHLLFAIIFGALGGWLVTRQRPRSPIAPPPAYTAG